jgi:3,4-dihydroxy-2-butanone 4-phosphate synthase
VSEWQITHGFQLHALGFQGRKCSLERRGKTEAVIDLKQLQLNIEIVGAFVQCELE